MYVTGIHLIHPDLPWTGSSLFMASAETADGTYESHLQSLQIALRAAE